MKYFRKLLIIVFIVLLASESFAQTFGVKAGLNLPNMIWKNDTSSSDNLKINPGFHLGATAELPITELFSFETGLLLSTKGYKTSQKETIMGGTIEYKVKLNLFYVDIPITAKAYYNVGGVSIYNALGPYLGVGLIGKFKVKVTGSGVTETYKNDIEWGSDEEYDFLRRLDFGLNASVGVEINSIQIGLSYCFGLANISTYTNNGTKINNRVLGISVCYKIRRK